MDRECNRGWEGKERMYVLTAEADNLSSCVISVDAVSTPVFFVVFITIEKNSSFGVDLEP
jgi:hypothetical protein